MGSGACWRAGDLAAAHIPDNTDPPIHVHRKCASRTLAVGAWCTLARADPDILILSGNLHAPGFLGLRDAGREQSKAEQNEQFTHSSLHKDIPDKGSTITILSNLPPGGKPYLLGVSRG